MAIFSSSELEKYQRSWHWKKYLLIGKITKPLTYIPIVGDVVACFWFAVLDEGPYGACHKWGALSFSFLNDGMKPTLWHTWIQINRKRNPEAYDEWGGIWPGGAPKNPADAERKRAKYREDYAKNSKPL